MFDNCRNKTSQIFRIRLTEQIKRGIILLVILFIWLSRKEDFMRQSKNKKREVTAALYVRLSRDDNLEGDSYSIGNQKKLLTKIAKEKDIQIS